MDQTHISLCRSVFASGSLTSEGYTQLWIDLINQIEHAKETVAFH